MQIEGFHVTSYQVNFGPLGPYGPGPLIILKNILSQICSRTILEINTAPGACLLQRCHFSVFKRISVFFYKTKKFCFFFNSRHENFPFLNGTPFFFSDPNLWSPSSIWIWNKIWGWGLGGSVIYFHSGAHILLIILSIITF